MNNKYLKTLLPHIISVFILILVSGIFFYPSFFEGKVMVQSDVIQAKGMQAEMRKIKEKEGRHVLWTNSMFSGMPTFQIWGGEGKSYNYLGIITSKLFRLNSAITVPYSLLFALFLGFYLLLISFGWDWKIGLAGALAFGLSTSHIHLIEAGHLTKVLAMAYLAPALAGVFLAYRGRLLIGGAIFALFMNLQIASNHYQITFYFLFVLAILGIVWLFMAIKEKTLPLFFKATGILAIAFMIGILPNLTKIWTTQEYSSETTRGKSELVLEQTDGQKSSQDGLDKDYAFGWSLGKLETFSLLVPNFMGATSGEYFVQDENSATLNALRTMNNPEKANTLAQYTGHYWGDQPFTSGAMYYGAVLIFLFFLGLFLVKSPLKWGISGSLILLIFFAWGRNFAGFNFFLFDHFPLFNKFRAVTMAAGMGHLLVALLGFWGLREMMSKDRESGEKLKALYYSGGISLGLCLLAILVGSSLTPAGPNDAAIFQDSPAILSALYADRLSLLRWDAFRSFGMISVVVILIWMYLKRDFPSMYLLIGISLVALIDIWGVNRRYLSETDFVSPLQQKSVVKARPVDEQVMADPDPHFRVLDMSRQGNPYANALPSYFHKSLGGYHAAKLMIYQELIDAYLLRPGDNLNILGMLNTKYLIGDYGGQLQAIPLQEALGNAWFVDEYQLVDNANAELDSLGSIDPGRKAIIQKKFSGYLDGLTNSPTPGDAISLSSYDPDKLVYSSSTANERLAIFSEIYYPPSKGWKVFIDDQPVEGFVKANYVLRALRVPAGQHTIEMRFEPDSYFNGQIFGRIGSLLLLILFIGGVYVTVKDKDWLNQAFPEAEEISEAPVVKKASKTVAKKKGPRKRNK